MIALLIEVIVQSVLITGANGFIGQRLCERLDSQHIPYKAGVRKLKSLFKSSSDNFSATSHEVSYGDLALPIDWTPLLEGCDSVIHLAARVHVMSDKSLDPFAEFRKVNCEATIHLATQAKNLGIRKFIYVSSIKVNGEFTTDKPFSSQDKPSPEDPYGISKFEAEEKLRPLHDPQNFEVIIIRPPLVYGPGVKANFSLLMKLARLAIPLPFAEVNNKRSLVSVYNLVDLLIVCLKCKSFVSAPVFLVADNTSYSLNELITKLAKVQNKKVHLYSFPVSIILFFAEVFGLSKMANRLFGNLEVDIEETKNLLNWHPPYTFEQSFKMNSTKNALED